jgi:hypothetical protein
MVIRSTHLSVKSFDTILNQSFGRNVSHIPRTKAISNISGAESYTEASSQNIYCYFMRMSQAWVWDKASKIEGGSAVLLAKIDDSVQKDDLIEADGVQYVIKDIFNVPGVYNKDGTVELIYSYCNLFLYEDA